jgi:hypothetical protein
MSHQTGPTQPRRKVPKSPSLVRRPCGESLRTVRHLGFTIQAGPPDLEPEDLHLAVDCPFCRRPCDLPAGASALAECDACDVEFDFDPDDVYAAAARAESVADAA